MPGRAGGGKPSGGGRLAASIADGFGKFPVVLFGAVKLAASQSRVGFRQHLGDANLLAEKQGEGSVREVRERNLPPLPDAGDQAGLRVRF